MAVGTLGQMKTRVIRELGQRTDLAADVADAINDAIAIYQKERFRFSEVTPGSEPTFNTVVGQSVYTTAANANIGTLYLVDYLLLNIGATNQYLSRIQPVEIKLLLQTGTQSGQPTSWAYEGNEIIVYPVPSAVYSITIGGHIKIPAPANDGEAGNAWMNDAERLIRSRAKFEIATHVTRNPTMAAAMSPEPGGATYREWSSLKREGNRVVSTGRIRAMQF